MNLLRQQAIERNIKGMQHHKAQPPFGMSVLLATPITFVVYKVMVLPTSATPAALLGCVLRSVFKLKEVIV